MNLEKIFFTFFVSFWVSAASLLGHAQENLDETIGSQVRNAAPENADEALVARVSWMSDTEFALSVSVLIFGIIVILLQTLIIWKREFEANDIIKIFGLSFIILSTLFIITAGYDSEQIAPAMGLFGTIAGYILGRNASKTEVVKEK